MVMISVLKGLGSNFKELKVVIRAQDSSISFEKLHDKLVNHEMFLKHEEFKKKSVFVTSQFN